MQAFAIACHACHVHLGTKLGQAEGPQPAALPCFLSAQSARLPLSNSIALPQVEVTYSTTPGYPLAPKLLRPPLHLSIHDRFVYACLLDLVTHM